MEKIIKNKYPNQFGDFEEKIISSKEQTRIRINFKINAKGEFQPDITSEAETVETAMANLEKAHTELALFAIKKGLLKKKETL